MTTVYINLYHMECVCAGARTHAHTCACAFDKMEPSSL